MTVIPHLQKFNVVLVKQFEASCYVVCVIVYYDFPDLTGIKIIILHFEITSVLISSRAITENEVENVFVGGMLKPDNYLVKAQLITVRKDHILDALAE